MAKTTYETEDVEEMIASRSRTSTLRYSVSSLFKIIKEQDDEKGDVLAASKLRNSPI